MNILATLALVAFAATSNPGDDVLATARQLYATASFDEALVALDTIAQGADPASHTARLVDEYRMFSLFALKRVPAAEAVAEALIRRDPLAPLQSGDASPRILVLYDRVRARLLPQMVRDRYHAGHVAIAARDLVAADRELSIAESLIAEAERVQVADAGLADLRMLVEGFRALSKGQRVTPPLRSTALTASRSVVAVPASLEKTLYRVGDADVVPPVAITEALPAVPASVRAQIVGSQRPTIVNLTIDEIGRVEKADLVSSVNPVYDRMVLGAASRWRYKAATRNGVPVAYQKVLAVTVQ